MISSMRDLTLVIGNKNYSSWSLRPWILMKHLGMPFREVQLPLDSPEFELDIGRWSPTRRVPVLRDGARAVWDSLAICEYVCELAGAGWPKDFDTRAHARSIAAEMHSGFQALRQQWPMNIRAERRRVAGTPALAADVARIQAIWGECRSRYASSGPWLFGEYSAADAMYAPVSFRFRTYDENVTPTTHEYMQTVLNDPLLAEWVAAARIESWTIAAEELGAAQGLPP
jgi:glutathione S-transferase